jgi:hypothetical protein
MMDERIFSTHSLTHSLSHSLPDSPFFDNISYNNIDDYECGIDFIHNMYIKEENILIIIIIINNDYFILIVKISVPYMMYAMI